MSLGRSAHNHSSSYQEEDNPYWISFSDIMAGLLIIFVLASIVLILELTQIKAQATQAINALNQAQEIRREMLREIRDELHKRHIAVTLSDNETVLRLPESVLSFDSGAFELPNSAKPIADTIGTVISRAIQKNDRWQHLDTIFIEGHTDNVPFKKQHLKGNWGLSSFRAIALWDYWRQTLTNNINLDTLQNHAGKPLFSVSGYAETRPIQVEQVTDEQRRKNRRIDIRFTVKKPDLESYQQIKNLL